MQGRSRRSKGGSLGTLSAVVLNVLLGGNLVSLFVLWAVAACQWVPPQDAPFAAVLCMTLPAVVAINLLFVPLWLIVHLRYMPVPIVGMLLCCGSIYSYCPAMNGGADTTGCSLKVVTYNVHYFGGLGAPSDSTNSVVRWLLRQEADILLLQEGIVADCRALLRDAGYEMSHDGSQSIYSRMPIVDRGQIEVPSVNGNNGNKVIWARLANGDDTISVINVHFESFCLKDGDKTNYRDVVQNPMVDSVEVRSRALIDKVSPVLALHGQQSDVVREFVDAEMAAGRPVIVGGDFNDVPGSYAVSHLRSVLTDCFRAAGSGPGFTFSENMMHFRIDHMLCSAPLAPRAARVDKTIADSDHYPLVVWF